MVSLHALISQRKHATTAHADMLKNLSGIFTKPDAFLFGSVVTITAHDASRTSEFNKVTHKALTTTCKEELALAKPSFAAILNATFFQDFANNSATADIIIDGQTIASSVPAVTLLAVERELTRFLEVFSKCPTHRPGTSWKPKETAALQGVWEAEHPAIEKKGEKVVKPFVLSQATEHHPAQVDKMTTDVPVADVVTIEETGTLSPREKADIITRVNKLLLATQEALTRANSNTVELPPGIGPALANYVLP